MKKFLILGGYEPYTIESETWDEALWKAWESLKESLAAIILIPEEQI